MSDTLVDRGAFGPDDLSGDKRRQLTERAVRQVLRFFAVLAVVISGLIVYSLIREAWIFISQVEWATLWTDGWFPRRDTYDIKTLVVATVIVTAIGIAVAAPLGLGAAVYLSEYAKPKVRKVVKPILEVLASIPSVALGFFAFTVLSPELVQRVFSGTQQANMLAAGLGVGILLIPLVASISEDALRSVPDSLREASYGMGARKVTTSIKVVIPAAVSGLVAALIIAVSRAIGETMVVFLAGGRSGGALFTSDPLEPGLTMTAAMASVASGTDQVKGAGLTFQSLFFVGLLLFLVTLVLNVIADRFVRRVRQKY